MQELVHAVRDVGAKNLILLGGLSYSNSLAQFNQYVPKDPLKNIAAAWHSYNFNKCNYVDCWNQYVLPTVKKYPLITTEIGENDCAGGYVTAVMKWLDAHAGGNYLAWTFNTWECSDPGPSLISSYDNNGTPTPYGAAIKLHFTSFESSTGTNHDKNKKNKSKKNKKINNKNKKDKKKSKKNKNNSNNKNINNKNKNENKNNKKNKKNQNNNNKNENKNNNKNKKNKNNNNKKNNKNSNKNKNNNKPGKNKNSSNHGHGNKNGQHSQGH